MKREPDLSSAVTPARLRLPIGLLLAAGLALSACQRPGTPSAGPALSASAAASAAQTAPSLTQKADALLALHRQMVVLMDGETALKPAEREAVSSVGLMLFHDLQKGQRALVEQAFAKDAPLEPLAQLLDRIEGEPSWFDADRLAFKDLLLQLQQRLGASQSIAGLKLAKRAQEDLAVLAEVEQAYERELRDTFGRFAQRGIELKREKWTDYVAKLKTLYNREQILKDYATILPSMQAKPSAGKSERELFGQQLPEKTVLLSFDDGPHGRYTDEILEILQRYQAPAIFFELGQNLGSVDAQGQVKPGPGSDVAKRVLAAGHQLANHSFTHGLMSKFCLLYTSPSPRD